MEPDLFHLDESGAPPSPRPGAAATAPSSTPGSTTPPGEQEIALERRVLLLVESSDKCCSICLDDYTAEDPGAPTTCGHHFHLQCIMQWAQRSRECPLCFRMLQLEDEDMNALLPFGEYVSPAQRAAEQATLETWELERLLIRLATGGPREHRQHRSGRHHSSSGGGAGAGAGAGAGGHGSSSRHRRQGSRGEASAPQPIRVGGGASDAAAAHVWAVPGEGAAANGGASSSSSREAAAAATPPAARTPPAAAMGGRAQDVRPASAPSAASLASWLSPGELQPSSSFGRGLSGGDEGHMVSPRSRSGALSLKGRFASLRLKDKLDKTAKELKSLFSPGSTGSAGGGSARGPSDDGSSAASTHQ